MKNKILLLIIPLNLSINGCTPLPQNIEKMPKEETVSFYDATQIDESTTSFDQIKLKDAKLAFVEGNELLPYITMEEYLRLLSDLFEEDSYFNYFRDNTTITGQMSCKGRLCCIAEIDLEFCFIRYSGSIKIKNDSNNTASMGVSLYSKGISRSEDYSFYSYQSLGFNTYHNSGKFYFPLGLLDALFSNDTGYSLIYTYEGLYRCKEYKQLTMKVNNESVISKGQSITKDIEMPFYMRRYNQSCFYFIMENFYGLAKTRNIYSMLNYYTNSNVSEMTLSDDPTERAQGYVNALSMLDDGHSGFRFEGSIWNEEPANINNGKLWSERKALSAQLKKNKQEVLFNNRLTKLSDDEKEKAKIDDPENQFEILYSEDSKTAFFSFDSFSYLKNVNIQNNNEQIKDYYKEDTFFLFIKQLSEIREHDGVRDVIIDVSTNGGGSVIILFKLLAMISNSNKSLSYFYEDTLGQISEYTTNVDTNFDGVFDALDVYGDDFNFYILASPYSFSCGNAFPYYAQKQNFAKIIGQRSGGGECSVVSSFLPNGMFFYHSSNLHIGWYDANEKAFDGSEEGAAADIEIDYKDYYDINALSRYISENK